MLNAIVVQSPYYLCICNYFIYIRMHRIIDLKFKHSTLHTFNILSNHLFVIANNSHLLCILAHCLYTCRHPVIFPWHMVKPQQALIGQLLELQLGQ